MSRSTTYYCRHTWWVWESVQQWRQQDAEAARCHITPGLLLQRSHIVSVQIKHTPATPNVPFCQVLTFFPDSIWGWFELIWVSTCCFKRYWRRIFRFNCIVLFLQLSNNPFYLFKRFKTRSSSMLFTKTWWRESIFSTPSPNSQHLYEIKVFSLIIMFKQSHLL